MIHGGGIRVLVVISAASMVAAAGCRDEAGSRSDGVTTRTAALTGGTFSSANLDLQVLTNSCGANQAQDFFQVINKGTAPITLSDVTIKLWANDTSSSALAAQVSTGGCLLNSTGSCVHNVSGVTAIVTPFSPACGPDASHQANREITISNNDHTALAAGQRWTNLQAAFHLANFSNFVPGTTTWYSPCLTGSSYADDAHFAIYVQGNLVFSSAVTAPSCRGPHGQQQLSGHITPAMSAAPVIGPLPESQVVNLAIGLPAQDPAGLQTLLQQVSDPSSPTYRHYLTVDQFATAHGAVATDYQAVVNWAQANGLTVGATSANRLLLDVSGTPSTVGKALFANLIQCRRSDGTIFYRLDREPSVNLATTLLHISNTNNFVRPQSRAQTGGPAGRNGSGPAGNYQAPDFRNAYASCTTRTGAGQRVGQIQFDGWSRLDITTYEADTGLPNVVVTPVLLDKLTACPGDPSGSICPSGNGSLETALDIEMAIAMAPGLSEVVEFQGTVGADILNAMATRQPLINQLSGSWGFEFDANTQQLVNEFVAQGQSFFDASGDEGAFSTDPGDDRDLQNTTLVGGTILTMGGSGATYSSETGWPGSFGGTLVNVPFPVFQQGIDMSTNGGTTTSRNAPDIALVAQGVEVVYSSPTPATHRGGVSGTSIAAPLWAGFMALINEQNAAVGLPPVGFANPVMYAIGKAPLLYPTDFNDAVGGNNGGFTAVAGYDLVTGWGSGKCNLIDQLANATPTAPSTAVATGFFHSCALRPGGAVECWGDNSNGQLGDGTTTTRLTPVAVVGLTGATAIAAGGNHTCALLTGGTVSCWGDNGGDVGDGTTTQRTTPVSVVGLTGVVAIAAGNSHSCAVLSDGTAQCWGLNILGALGDGTTTNRTTPVPVQGLTGAKAIAAGAHTCALLTGGGISCWGDNSHGQLGDGTTANQLTPVAVQGLGGTATAVVVGEETHHTCALISNGTMECWGENLQGVLGDGTTTERHSPTPVSGLSGVVAIATANRDSCAVVSNGGVFCWGFSEVLGNGSTTDSLTPVAVSNLTTAIGVDMREAHACARLRGGDVVCWGENGGDLGNGTAIASLTPVTVIFF